MVEIFNPETEIWRVTDSIAVAQFGGDEIGIQLENGDVLLGGQGSWPGGLLVCTTPAYSPESNGMAEAFVKTFKRYYVYLADLPDAETVLGLLGAWFEDYKENHPKKGLEMMSPKQSRRAKPA